MFKFAWPFAFLLIPVLWIILKYWPATRKENEAMLRIPFLNRIDALHSPSSTLILQSFSMRYLLGVGTWLMLITAAANPEWLGDPLPVKQDGRNIMLAVDLSPSMSIPDLQHNRNPANRLQIVKEVAANFIDKRVGDKLGLILFGSKAYLQTPITFDRTTVSTMLDDATIGLAGERTAIGDALGLAIKKLSNEDAKSRILILLTDGGNNSGMIEPLKAAELAKDNQIKIYTVGIGATEMLINSFAGGQVINPSADLDEDLLKKIASMTDGQYFRAQDEKTMMNILEAINQLEPISIENKTARPVTSLFYWPLLTALLLFSLLIFPYHGKGE